MRTIYHFEITNPKKRHYTLLGNMLLLLAGGAYVLYRHTEYSTQRPASVFGSYVLPITLFAVVLWRFYFVWKRKDIAFTQMHFIIIFTLCWALSGEYLYAGILFFLGLFERLVNRDTVCVTDEHGVHLLTLPAKHYAWNRLENVMIKDGMFTLDRRDNHLFQLDISGETLSFSEAEYNAFCRKHLE